MSKAYREREKEERPQRKVKAVCDECGGIHGIVEDGHGGYICKECIKLATSKDSKETLDIK